MKAMEANYYIKHLEFQKIKHRSDAAVSEDKSTGHFVPYKYYEKQTR